VGEWQAWAASVIVLLALFAFLIWLKIRSDKNRP
jgi:hypothetical protein